MRFNDRLRGRQMQEALAAVLNQVPGSRRALAPLAALEDALGRRGACAVDQVPPHWLGRVISQLGNLPMSEEDSDLQDLLHRLCARQARLHAQPPASLAASAETPPRPPAAEPRPAATPAATPLLWEDKFDDVLPPNFGEAPRVEFCELEPEVFRTVFGDRLPRLDDVVELPPAAQAQQPADQPR